MEKKLEVKNLQISFRTQGGILKAVRDISFDLYKGETLAIVGESGSGKSVTSKAIIGILAGNSIVEGGEILYDGKDLLKIAEDDFHKIRGDKIAMIFQDPLSSLNPIMKIGQQLTEAMILKAKSSRKNSRAVFNSLLKKLKVNVDKVNSDNPSYDSKVTTAKIDEFDKFCIASLTLEGAYNDAISEVLGLELDIDDALFLIEKKQKVDVKKRIKNVLKTLDKCVHPYALVKTQEVLDVINSLQNLINVNSEININEAVVELNKLLKIIKETSLKKAPNFFTLGYYKMKNPNNDLSNYSIDELDDLTKNYLNDNFLNDFIKTILDGVKYSYQTSIKKKKELVSKIENILDNLDMNNPQTTKIFADLVQESKSAIDQLNVHKNSTEYTFGSAIKSALNSYYNGVKKNPKEQARYDRQAAKYQKLVDANKTPDWKLKPANLVDLDLCVKNIKTILNNLLNTYKNAINNTEYFDASERVNEIIDFLKEQASIVVSKMTKKMAKAKALKLLEEVGIPEPRIRFNQYPFEFSGGMRQRVVIAIALSANPDILICDEPTTALDVTIQSQILELINRLKVQRNLSVIFITHNLGVVANMADRIAVMYAGKIVEYGTSEDVFYDPRHPYTWALLSSMPDLETKEKLEAIPGTPPNMIFPPKGDAFAARNKYALEIDFELQPPLFEVSETHYAATWLLHPNAPQVELPKIIQRRIDRVNKEKEEHGE